MRYTLRRHLSRTWLLASIALALAALAIIGLVAASPGGLIRLGQNTVSGNNQSGSSSNLPDHPPGSKHTAYEPTQLATTTAIAATGIAADPPLPLDEVLAAFNCARQRAQLPPYLRDPQLDQEAATLLQRTLRSGEEHLHPGEHGYTLTGQLLLDTADELSVMDRCTIGGVDVTEVPDLDKAQRIGIALAAVPNAYQRPLYQAIVIGR